MILERSLLCLIIYHSRGKQPEGFSSTQLLFMLEKDQSFPSEYIMLLSCESNLNLFDYLLSVKDLDGQKF